MRANLDLVWVEERDANRKCGTVGCFNPAVEIRGYFINRKTKKQSIGEWRTRRLCKSCFDKAMETCIDPKLATAKQNEGIGRSYWAASEAAREAMTDLIVNLCQVRPYFPAEDIWPMFETQYPELSAVTNKSALGGVTRKLSSGPGRIMTQIMKYEKSKRPAAHNKPKLIWCSLLLVHDVKAFEEYLNSGVTYMGEEVSREATFYRKGTGSDDDGNDGGGESGAA